MLWTVELLLFIMVATLVAVAAQRYGADTRDRVRAAERSGCDMPLTV